MIILLGIFLYLLIGVGVLSILLWHDRHVKDSFDTWISDIEEFQVLAVVFWIFPLMWIILWAIYKAVQGFIRLIQVFFTTLVYTVGAIIKGNKE